MKTATLGSLYRNWLYNKKSLIDGEGSLLWLLTNRILSSITLRKMSEWVNATNDIGSHYQKRKWPKSTNDFTEDYRYFKVTIKMTITHLTSRRHNLCGYVYEEDVGAVNGLKLNLNKTTIYLIIFNYSGRSSRTRITPYTVILGLNPTSRYRLMRAPHTTQNNWMM